MLRLKSAIYVCESVRLLTFREATKKVVSWALVGWAYIETKKYVSECEINKKWIGSKEKRWGVRFENQTVFW